MHEAQKMPQLECRKCGAENPMTYFGPVVVDGFGTCICFDCASLRGWLDRDGNIKAGHCI